jgi:DNA-binding response OmpR family regulator
VTPPANDTIPRVLLAEESLPYRRLIREALTAFRVCEVDEAPNGESAFAMGLRRPYALYIFALSLPDMKGDLMDRLLSLAGPLVHTGTHASPPVIYLLRQDEDQAVRVLSRDARTRGHVFVPPKLDQLLAAIAGLLPERDPLS